MTSHPPLPATWPVWVAAAAAFLAATAYLWFGWCVFPLSDWNEVRLAPAFALRHGLTVYAPLGGGPLSTWIYGPLGIALNLPATFASSPAAAVEIAGAINLLTLIVPLAIVSFTVGAVRPLPWPARVLVLALSVLLTPTGSLVYQVADHAAIACGLLSCWCLTRRTAAESALGGAAAWCVLSMAAKQTSVFLVLAHVIYLARYQDRGAVVRYLGWTAGLGILLAALGVMHFGFRPLWFNLVEIPARLPWGDAAEKIALRWPQLLAYVGVPLVLLPLCARSRFWPEPATELGRVGRCAVIVVFTLLPVGLLSYFKIGGDTNVLHSWYYAMPCLVVGFVAHACARPAGWSWLVLATTGVIAIRIPELRALPARPLTQHVEQACQLAKVAPHTAWFPNNPVVTFYTDGKLYHVEDGLATRHLAGLGVREADFRRHLPSQLTVIAYPASFTSPFALQLLPEFTLATRVSDWALYQRSAAPKPATAKQP